MTRPEDKTILVVDDEPDIRLYLQTLLEDHGFKVLTAGDGDEALAKIKEHRPDFISLDLMMPRKTGIKLCYELRKNREWARIPVMIVTGHARDEAVQRDLKDIFADRVISGPGVYLEKPIKPADYVNLVKRELGIAEAAPAPREEESLRGQVRDLLSAADLDTLQQALRVLQEKKK